MALESKLENKKKSEDKRKEVLHLDTWPKTLCFAIGTAISGGDPEVGRYMTLKFMKYSDKIKNYQKKDSKNKTYY
jgi:hypothetical protein